MPNASDTTGTVARVMTLLRAITESPHPLGIKQIAQATGLPASTTHRLLDLLAEGNFVQKNPATRKYGVGKDVIRIAHLVATRSPITGFIQPILDDLTRQTGETALFAMYVAGQHRTVYMAKSDTPAPLRFRGALTQRIAPARTAAGRAGLARLPAREQAQAIAMDVAAAGSAPVSGDVLASRLARVRADHYAVSEGEELPGLVGIAVAATLPPGTIEGALAVAIPEVRFDRQSVPRYHRMLSAAADRLARFDVEPREGT